MFISKSLFQSLSDFTLQAVNKDVLGNILVTDTGYCATNGHTLAIVQTDKTVDFTQNSEYQIYGYNCEIRDATLAQSRKIGYNKKTKYYATKDRKYTGSNAYPHNVTRLIPSKNANRVSLTFDLDNIDPIEMFANHPNCETISLFIDWDTQALVYVPRVVIEQKDDDYRVKYYSVKHTDTLIEASKHRSGFEYLTSVNPNYLIDIWNLANELKPKDTRFSLEVVDDKQPIRFNIKTLGKMHGYGVIMPIQVKQIEKITAAAK